MPKKLCAQCKREKPDTSFRQIGSNPIKWSDRCLVCLGEEEAERLRAKNAARKEEKQAKRAERVARNVKKSNARCHERWRKQQQKLQADAKRRAEEERIEREKVQRDKMAKNEAERELYRRELARRHLLYFIQRMDPKYQPGWVHENICSKLEGFLEDVLAGNNPRMLLCMPPRHGKSEIASKKFPAWALGRHSNLEVIAASYGSSLPFIFSRHVRNILRDPAYQTVFPKTKLDPENQNVEGWMTSRGGIYIPAGVGGGITGKGANIFLIDDPIKDAQEADSETQRDSVWDWYGAVAYTRLAPLSGILMILTRWHDDDPAGRVLMQAANAQKEYEELAISSREQFEVDTARDTEAEREAKREQLEADLEIERASLENWDVVSYQAIAEQDEYLTDSGQIVYEPTENCKFLREKGGALHPERFPVQRLRMIKKVLQPRHWSALYQQNPVPDEGIYFKRDMFKYEHTVFDWRPFQVLIAVDLAISTKQTADWTVMVAGCLDFEGNLHILEMVRGQWDTFEIVMNLLELSRRYGIYGNVPVVGVENGPLKQAIYPVLRTALDHKKMSSEMIPAFDEELRPVTDKMTRARPLQGRMQSHGVIFPSDQEWLETMTHEMLRFPGGQNDDIVDALSWLVRMLERAAVPQRPKRKEDKSWKQSDAVIKALRGDSTSKSPMGA